MLLLVVGLSQVGFCLYSPEQSMVKFKLNILATKVFFSSSATVKESHLWIPQY